MPIGRSTKSEFGMKAVSRMKATQGSNAAQRRRIARITQSFVAPRLSVEERIAAGKSLRAKVPRSAHAELARADNRDPIGIILAQPRRRERHRWRIRLAATPP